MSEPGGTVSPPGRAQSPAATPDAPQPRVRDRQVLIAGALVVAIVLGLQLFGIVFPPFDTALSLAPVVIVVLVVITIAVLVRSVARRPSAP